MRRICVFCGSNFGARESYRHGAEALAQALAEAGLGLVYGGGRVGLMGIIADAALANGAEVYGVIPDHLMQLEVGHAGLTELLVTPDMHSRKAHMAELSDAFVALPGGIGTLEELFEVWTWSQLGIHAKPVGLLNVDGYFDDLLKFLEVSRDEQFVRPAQLASLTVSTDPVDLLRQLATASTVNEAEGYEAPTP